MKTFEHHFRCHHSWPQDNWTSSYPIHLRTPSTLEVCNCFKMSSVLCHPESRLSFPFKSASHLCTRISPFVYPRFKLKMQSGVKFEIKQWCWFGTQNSLLEYNRLDTTHLIIVTQSVGDLSINSTYFWSLSIQTIALTFVFYSSSFWLCRFTEGTEDFKF